jgi:hypothetical protein
MDFNIPTDEALGFLSRRGNEAEKGDYDAKVGQLFSDLDVKCLKSTFFLLHVSVKGILGNRAIASPNSHGTGGENDGC